MTANEHGIRKAIIHYIPELDKFRGYVGVELNFNGSRTTNPYMQTGPGDVEVDGRVFAVESDDGVSWTNLGEVSGAYNRRGHEIYPRAFINHNGETYLYTHRAQGGRDITLSTGSDWRSLNQRGSLWDLADGSDEIQDAFLHADGDTITIVAKDPKDWRQGGLVLADSSLSNPTQVGNWRTWFPRSTTLKHGKIFRDPTTQKWYLAMMANDLKDISLWTAPITGLTMSEPPIINGIAAAPNPAPGLTTKLSLQALDPEGDDITISWQVSQNHRGVTL